MGVNSGTTFRLWRAREFSVDEEAPDLGFILCSERDYGTSPSSFPDSILALLAL